MINKLLDEPYWDEFSSVVDIARFYTKGSKKIDTEWEYWEIYVKSVTLLALLDKDSLPEHDYDFRNYFKGRQSNLEDLLREVGEKGFSSLKAAAISGCEDAMWRINGNMGFDNYKDRAEIDSTLKELEKVQNVQEIVDFHIMLNDLNDVFVHG